MKKNWNRMGKGLIFVLIIAAVSLFSCCIIKMNRMQITLNELMSQVFYLQDSASVLQSDMGEMGTNLEAAFKEESSLIEDYSIRVTDCNFADGTYKVDITVLPKEYTETTQLTIYFGTKSYNLELSGIFFQGSATLSMANNYDGNVTVLFTNGEKRSTEVLSNYKDFQTTLKQAVSGSIAGVEDSYRDGEWTFCGTVDYGLDGQSSYEFASFHLIAEVGETTVYDYDLIRETGGAIVQEETIEGNEASQEQTDDGLSIGSLDIPAVGAAGDAIVAVGDLSGAETPDEDTVNEETANEAAGNGETGEDEAANGEAMDAEVPDEETPDAGAEDSAADSAEEQMQESEEVPEQTPDIPEASDETDESISGTSGAQTMTFACAAEETDIVTIYLTAVTTEGITLKLTLYEGTLKSSNEIRISDLTTYTPVLDYYDRKNVKY